MKPLVADEMFPEGIDIEDVSIQLEISLRLARDWLEIKAKIEMLSKCLHLKIIC